MSQPVVHDLSCLECQTYIYDPAKNWQAETRNGQKMRRIGTLPPCRLCPKNSPAEAWQHELSEKNHQAIAHYLRHKAMNFQGLSEAEKRDEIVQRNFLIIAREFERHERREEMEANASIVQQVIIAARGPKP